MATTTNYSWTTPDDTDLVKDGAAAIRSLGSAIDSTVFTNAGNAVAKTIVDAKGDLIAATAADTVARLAVGTNGQYLKANSSTSTGLEWGDVSAGGMTVLASGTLPAASTLTLSTISQSYKNLQLVVNNPYSASSSAALRIRTNGVTTSTYSTRLNGSVTENSQSAFIVGENQFTLLPTTSNSGNQMIFNFFDYANATSKKTMTFDISVADSTGHIYGLGSNTALTAISSITILTGGQDFGGGTYILYGVS